VKRFSIVLATLAFVPSALAEIEATTVIRQYDDSRTQVTTPEAEISGTFNKDTMKVSVGWASDILTSASADVATFASKGVIKDTRTEYSGSFESQIPDGTMSLGYIQSDENDYHSKTLTAGGTREFFTKNTVVSFGFAKGSDQVNSSSDKTFDQHMDNQNYSISLSQVLSKISILQMVYDFRVENGFLSSPYRRAKVIDPIDGRGYGIPENHPRTRNRNAIGVTYNYYHEPWKISFANSYRLYQDSWGVLSHTIEERFTREFSKRLSGSISLRYYTQGKASFYQDYYSSSVGTPPAPFYTGNNTLATYTSMMLGLRPTYLITDKILLFGKFEYFMQKFADASDAALISTTADDKKLEITAMVLGIGIDVKF
jgi:hypothetical protein